MLLRPFTPNEKDGNDDYKEEIMPRHIKTAALAGTQDEADAKTRTTV